MKGEIDLDNIMVSTVNAAGRPKGIDAEHLSKTWRIDLETVKTKAKHYLTPYLAIMEQIIGCLDTKESMSTSL
jgi:hypothetical protein